MPRGKLYDGGNSVLLCQRLVTNSSSISLLVILRFGALRKGVILFS